MLGFNARDREQDGQSAIPVEIADERRFKRYPAMLREIYAAQVLADPLTRRILDYCATMA